ncbi:MAG: GIY-YIG nuclease family protein [Lentimicrobiaceae bacterium]|jgi:putative endonuclease
MVLVYALSNEINNEVYIGITVDIERRLKEHNSGKSRYTKAYRPWKVFYFEVCDDYSAARKREVYFKTTSGRRELKGKLL